jgi:hypothetical protein
MAARGVPVFQTSFSPAVAAESLTQLAAKMGFAHPLIRGGLAPCGERMTLGNVRANGVRSARRPHLTRGPVSIRANTVTPGRTWS